MLNLVTDLSNCAILELARGLQQGLPQQHTIQPHSGSDDWLSLTVRATSACWLSFPLMMTFSESVCWLGCSLIALPFFEWLSSKLFLVLFDLIWVKKSSSYSIWLKTFGVDLEYEVNTELGGFFSCNKEFESSVRFGCENVLVVKVVSLLWLNSNVKAVIGSVSKQKDCIDCPKLWSVFSEVQGFVSRRLCWLLWLVSSCWLGLVSSTLTKSVFFLEKNRSSYATNWDFSKGNNDEIRKQGDFFQSSPFLFWIIKNLEKTESTDLFNFLQKKDKSTRFQLLQTIEIAKMKQA